MSHPGTTRYFAFLRAINTGGRRLTNDQLVQPFVEIGLEEVAAYQAAGNITFLSDRPEIDLLGDLSDALAAAYGFAAPCFLRTRDELIAVGNTKPFSAQELAGTAGRIQVGFMQAIPEPAALADAAALVPATDRVLFRGREWFWLPIKGIGDSQLPLPAIENIVGPMTVRTLGTVSRMLSRFG